MSIESGYPKINMSLIETDIYILQEFIANENVEGEFTERYLILYDFAVDCSYSKHIQPELIIYLLPFYFKAIEQAVICNNMTAIDIYCNFNSAVFINQKNFKYAVGEKNYHYVMEYYIEQTIEKMKAENLCSLNWVSLFNTTAAFYKDNILLLFKRIFEGSLRVKYLFFKYLSVLLFAERDNLFAVDEPRDYWSDYVWYFDSAASDDLFWSNDVIERFDNGISPERIEALFKEVKPLLCDVNGADLADLVGDEMCQSLTTGIFHNRKAEYLQKMNCKSEKYRIWNSY